MSVLNDILNGTVTAVTGLGLVFPDTGSLIPVAKRKLPQKLEILDPPVQITVYRDERGEDFKYFTFGGNVSKTYSVLIAIVSPNDSDQVHNLDTYCDWRQQIETLYAPVGGFANEAAIQALAGSLMCWDIRVKPGVFLDRRLISDQYDYQIIGVDFKALG